MPSFRDKISQFFIKVEGMRVKQGLLEPCLLLEPAKALEVSSSQKARLCQDDIKISSTDALYWPPLTLRTSGTHAFEQALITHKINR